jgi:DNA helicase-2/ATP-dependent DNA helicase PcrA
VSAWVAEQRSMSGLERLSGRIEGKDGTAVQSFVSDLTAARALGAAGTTGELLTAVFDELGLAGTLASFDLNRRGTNTSAQGDDLLALRHLAVLQPDPAHFASWLRDELDRAPDPRGVTLSTVHRVKGQEWPHVVVHLADADQFPHRLAEDLEEERRVFHVALTRTSERVLVVTTSQPSPFIRELTEEPGVRDVRSTPSVAAPPTSAAAPARSPSSGPSVFVKGSVIAGSGLVLVDQGRQWKIESVDDEGVTASAGAATRSFAFGARSATLGKQHGELARPPAATPEPSAAVFDRLRVMRDEVRHGKPAYTVFDDATLERIALALPSTLAELARVKGVGPAKLEQYGDAVIDVVNAVR